MSDFELTEDAGAPVFGTQLEPENELFTINLGPHHPATHGVLRLMCTMEGEWIREMKPEQQFVRDWKMDDLLPLLEQVKKGRSFDSGQAAFRLAGCIQCHRFAGAGGSVGPDLDGVGRRLSSRDLMESILLPSKVIVEGYATTEIETKSGEVVMGRVEREDNRVLVIRPPTANAGPVTLRKNEIGTRSLSKTSNMPTGTLNTLSETQILDLLAYLISEGNSEHAAFHSAPATR